MPVKDFGFGFEKDGRWANTISDRVCKRVCTSKRSDRSKGRTREGVERERACCAGKERTTTSGSVCRLCTSGWRERVTKQGASREGQRDNATGLGGWSGSSPATQRPSVRLLSNWPPPWTQRWRQVEQCGRSPKFADGIKACISHSGPLPVPERWARKQWASHD